MSDVQAKSNMGIRTGTAHWCAVINWEHVDVGRENAKSQQFYSKHSGFFKLGFAFETSHNLDKDLAPVLQVVIRIDIVS